MPRVDERCAALGRHYGCNCDAALAAELPVVHAEMCPSNDPSCGYQAGCNCKPAKSAEGPSREALMELLKAIHLRDTVGNRPWSVENGRDYDAASETYTAALARCTREAGGGGGES